MWQLFDIAYVIPASVFVGFWLGKYLKAKYGIDDYQTYSILAFAAIGFILTIVKIKRYVDSVNKNSDKKEKL